MIFFLTVLEPGGTFRDFMFAPGELETGFQFLNALVKKGNVLLTVAYMDGGRRTTLPTDAFDGTAFGDAMSELENEWQVLLRKPARLAVTFDKTWLIDRNRQRTGNCETSITNYQSLIDRLNVLINRSEKALPPGHQQTMLTDHYRQQIGLYQKRLDTLQHRQTSLQHRRRALIYM